MNCSFGSRVSNCNIYFTGNNYASNGNMNIYFRESTNFNGKVRFPKQQLNYVQSFVRCYNYNAKVVMSDAAVNCYAMFGMCNNFNQKVNLPNSIKDMFSMFTDCYNFNQPVTLPSNLVNAGSTFFNYYKFNQPLHLPDKTAYCVWMLYRCNGFNSSLRIPDNANAKDCLYNMGGSFNSPLTIGNNVYISNNQLYNQLLRTGFDNAYDTVSKYWTGPLILGENINTVGYQGLFRNMQSFIYTNRQQSDKVLTVHAKSNKTLNSLYQSYNCAAYGVAINLYTDDAGINYILNLVPNKNDAPSSSGYAELYWEPTDFGYKQVYYEYFAGAVNYQVEGTYLIRTSGI